MTLLQLSDNALLVEALFFRGGGGGGVLNRLNELYFDIYM